MHTWTPCCITGIRQVPPLLHVQQFYQHNIIIQIYSTLANTSTMVGFATFCVFLDFDGSSMVFSFNFLNITLLQKRIRTVGPSLSINFLSQTIAAIFNPIPLLHVYDVIHVQVPSTSVAGFVAKGYMVRISSGCIDTGNPPTQQRY